MTQAVFNAGGFRELGDVECAGRKGVAGVPTRTRRVRDSERFGAAGLVGTFAIRGERVPIEFEAGHAEQVVESGPGRR